MLFFEPHQAMGCGIVALFVKRSTINCYTINPPGALWSWYFPASQAHSLRVDGTPQNPNERGGPKVGLIGPRPHLLVDLSLFLSLLFEFLSSFLIII